MSLLGKWFVKVVVDKSSVKRDLAETKAMVVSEARATQQAVQRVGGAWAIGGIDKQSLQNRAQAIRAMAQLKLEQRSLAQQTVQTANTLGMLNLRLDTSAKSFAKWTASMVGARAGLQAFGPAGLAVAATIGSVLQLSKFLGTDYQLYAHFWDGFRKGAQGATRDLADLIVKYAEMRAGSVSPDEFGPKDLPGTRHRVPGKPLNFDPRKQYSDDEKKQLQTQFGNIREILSLELRAAELNKDAAAVRRLTQELGDLAVKEAEVSGLSVAHAKNVRDLTLANLDQAQSIDMRTASLEQLAALEADFIAATRSGNRNIHSAEAFTPLDTLQNEQFSAAFLKGLNTNLSAGMLAPSQTIFEQLAAEYRKNATTMVDVYRQATMSVEGLFSDVLYAGITGNIDKIDDAFKDFLKSLARQISNFLAQQAVMKIFGAALGTNVTAGSGGFISGSFSPPKGWANGGIIPGGFRAFASGGVVNQPTLGLVGEGRYNEAVVPLPDGKSIPVEMKGAGAGVINQTIVLVNDPSEYRTGPNEIVTIVQSDILRGGPIKKAIDLRSK